MRDSNSLFVPDLRLSRSCRSLSAGRRISILVESSSIPRNVALLLQGGARVVAGSLEIAMVNGGALG